MGPCVGFFSLKSIFPHPCNIDVRICITSREKCVGFSCDTSACWLFRTQKSSKQNREMLHLFNRCHISFKRLETDIQEDFFFHSQGSRSMQPVYFHCFIRAHTVRETRRQCFLSQFRGCCSVFSTHLCVSKQLKMKTLQTFVIFIQEEIIRHL